MRPGTLSRIMLLLASGLLAFQALLLMTYIFPASFEGLGALSKGTISLILFQIVILSSIVGIISLIGLRDKDGRSRSYSKFASIVLFIVGLIFSAEGLVAINLNGSIITGTTSILMICMGLELFTVGVLSMVSYVQNEEKPSFPRSNPYVAAILFILLMLPPAFLVF